MIPKRKAPYLNRQQRRHPVRFQRELDKSVGGWAIVSNYLLAGLFIRAGITPAINAEGAQV